MTMGWDPNVKGKVSIGGGVVMRHWVANRKDEKHGGCVLVKKLCRLAIGDTSSRTMILVFLNTTKRNWAGLLYFRTYYIIEIN